MHLPLNPFPKRRIERLPDAQDGMLRVPYKTFEQAKRAFPACEKTALRAYVRSEAARYANALVRLPEWRRDFGNVVALFADTSRVAEAALRSRRFDFQFMLIKSDAFERRIAARLVREGRLPESAVA